jgi:hypothetical protein
MSGRVTDFAGARPGSTGGHTGGHAGCHTGDRGHAGVSERAPDHHFLCEGFGARRWMPFLVRVNLFPQLRDLPELSGALRLCGRLRDRRVSGDLGAAVAAALHLERRVRIARGGLSGMEYREPHCQSTRSCQHAR